MFNKRSIFRKRKAKSRGKGLSKPPDDTELLPLLMTVDVDVAPSPQHSKSHWAKLEEVLKHPLVLLLITSVFLPIIIFYLNQHRTLIELRQKKAAEIVEKNAAFEGQLYSLYLDVTVFHTNNVLNPPKDEREMQERKSKFTQAWDARYIELRKMYPENNIWVNELYPQGVILQLFSFDDVKNLRSTKKRTGLISYFSNPPANLLRLKNDVDNYQWNVENSLTVVGDLRGLVDAPTYDIKRGGATDTRISGDITAKYNKFRSERSVWLNNLVEDINP